MNTRSARALALLFVVATSTSTAAAAAPVAPVASVASTDVPTLSVDGLGKVNVVPDQAIVTLGVQTEGANLLDVKKKNDAAAAQIIAAAKKAGVDARHIQTTSVSIQQQYDERGQPARGFIVSRDVVICIVQLPRFDAVVADVVAAGANRLSSVQLQSSKEAALKDQARALAVDDARHQAQLFAKQAGFSTFKIRTIDAGTNNTQRPMAYGAAREAMAADGAFAAGELEVSASVHIVYELIP